MPSFLLVLSIRRFDSTGKVRLAKWFQTLPSKTKAKILKDVTQLVLARRTRMCNFLEYKGMSTLVILLALVINRLACPNLDQNSKECIDLG